MVNKNNDSDSTNTDNTEDNTCPSTERLEKTALVLENVNSIKDNLAKLPLNPAEKEYIETNIDPLLGVINIFSNVSANLASSVDQLDTSYVTTPKKSKINHTEELMYDINEDCEEIYRIIKKRLRPILKCH